MKKITDMSIGKILVAVAIAIIAFTPFKEMRVIGLKIIDYFGASHNWLLLVLSADIFLVAVAIVMFIYGVEIIVQDILSRREKDH